MINMIYRRRLRTLTSTKQKREAKFLQLYKKPTYKVDHMVLERYPTFQHALQDLDDGLSSCFLYSCFAKEKGIRTALVQMSRRVTTEFMNYVIESRALRKVFVTIKGYFYRAHIQGEKVTWMIPHAFHPEIPRIVDIRIMGTFLEFYCTFLGFVNFKLYSSLNLHYPPKLPFEVRGEKKVTTAEEEENHILQSLSIPIKRTFDDSTDINDDDHYDLQLMSGKNDKKLKLAQLEQDRMKRQTTLFQNVKFYLGRETNRESLTFVIRSAGGLVSWDATLGVGCTYEEDDKTIAYQIVDRPSFEKKYLTRYYIQPQWVYDSFNNGMLLPVQDYFVGTDLPAHLSPFEETYTDTYIPPEMQRIKAHMSQIELIGDKRLEEMDADFSSSEDEDKGVEKRRKKGRRRKKMSASKSEDAPVVSESSESEDEPLAKKPVLVGEDEPISESGVKKHKSTKKEDPLSKKAESVSEEDTVIERGNEENPLDKMVVKRGKPVKRNFFEERKRQTTEDYKLATTFIHRKQKRLFKRIKKKENRVKQIGEKLKVKRIMYEKEMQKRRKRMAKELSRNQEDASTNKEIEA